MEEINKNNFYKEYSLKKDNDLYMLRIEIELEYINLSIKKLNKAFDYLYRNKVKITKLIDELKLDEKYKINNYLILNIFDTIYENNKIIINNNNNNIEQIKNNENNYNEKNNYDITLDEKNKIINELKKENEKLKLKINGFNERINHIILYYEKYINSLFNNDKKYQNNYHAKNHKDNMEFVKNKNTLQVKEINTKNLNANKNDIIESKNEINQKLEKNDIINKGNIIILDEPDYISNDCSNCYNKNNDIIYKCILCNSYFLCEKCYNNMKKTVFHDHVFFFEIKYPKELLEKNMNIIIGQFNIYLKNLFFDENGNLSTEPNAIIYEKKLQKICNDLKDINISPDIYFSDYRKSYINFLLTRLDQKNQDIIIEKIVLLSNKIIKCQ